MLAGEYLPPVQQLLQIKRVAISQQCFQEDGTFLFGGAATGDCEDGDYSGTWSLNGKTFTVTAEQNTTSYQLESFDGHALVLSTSGTLNSEPATYYVSFTKQ